MTPAVFRASQVAPLRLRRLTVVLCRPVRGVARRGAIHDARCRNGTIGRPRLASADVACCGRFVVLYWPFCGIASVIRASQVAPLRLRAVDCCFAVAGSRHCVGHPGVTSGAPTFAGRLNVVWRRPVRGFAVVIRASRVASVRLRGGRMLFCVGRPGVTSGARAFAGRSTVVLRWSSGRHKWRPCVCGAVECCFVSAGSRRSP